jgi:catechol 2,3-dioxygenase-like lactoylglutathione lyase family enzyme
MGKKLRAGDPWMPGYRYAATMPPLSLNLVVSDIERALRFYREVLNAHVHYSDVDFAAIQVGGASVMLHADHTHADHPWHDALAAGAARGLGAQVRLLGIDPDEVEGRARALGAEIARATESKGHGWREVLVRDPDGYEWAVGVLDGRALEVVKENAANGSQ